MENAQKLENQKTLKNGKNFKKGKKWESQTEMSAAQKVALQIFVTSLAVHVRLKG